MRDGATPGGDSVDEVKVRGGANGMSALAAAFQGERQRPAPSTAPLDRAHYRPKGHLLIGAQCFRRLDSNLPPDTVRTEGPGM